MTELDVLVVGAGPAGLAAATEIRSRGLSVEIVEQRSTIGGAIYRQPVSEVAALPQAKGVHERWKVLSEVFAAHSIPVRFACVFLGIDGDGKILVEDRQGGLVRQLSARAVIFAVGAVESVLPRPGWHLAGVATAGGLQVMMKETGYPPAGRVLLAGSGPLLMAVAAQMAKLGNPPVAVVEAGDPLRKFGSGLSLASCPALASEAVGYMWAVWRSGVPWIRGARLRTVSRNENGLRATVVDGKCQETVYQIDRIGLHDGISPNHIGLPAETLEPGSSPIILHAGDCREALGAEAAIMDGRLAGQTTVGLLSGTSSSVPRDLGRFRRIQATLSHVFAPASGAEDSLAALPDETVLCRCENRTVGDLKRLCGASDPLTGREVKHNGRFAMGACQGRFCAVNTAALMAKLRPDLSSTSPADLTGKRWPIRPVSLGALIAGTDKLDTSSQDVQTTKEA